MTRISRDEKLMNAAILEAYRSTCCRAHVGAVFARDGRSIMTGYNGAAAGKPHCTPETCNPSHPCLNTVHAEMGGIHYAARKGISLEGSELFSTHMPCLNCSDGILNAGVIRVVYLTPYRLTDGIENLMDRGIIVQQYQGRIYVPMPQV